MRLAFSFFAILPFLLASSGCAELSRAGFDVATPGSGLLPPKPGAVTEASIKLRDLPPPAAPVAVAVYGYGDQTGQMKPVAPTATVAPLSRAVTQGATSILIKALQDAGSGGWFTVVERERLDNLLKERRIIADMRASAIWASRSLILRLCRRCSSPASSSMAASSAMIIPVPMCEM